MLEDGHIQPHVVRKGEGLRLTGVQADVEYELGKSPTAEVVETARAEIVAGGESIDTPRSAPGNGVRGRSQRNDLTSRSEAS